jgi:signal transduction histidine kinase
LNNANIIAKSIKKTIGLRVTMIASDGKVLGESDEDFRRMDNHLKRPEVILSKYQKHGTSLRYSRTLNKELLYVSKKFTHNNEEYFIRMARDIEVLTQSFIYLWVKVALLFLIFMILALWFSLKRNKEVEEETQKILNFLRELSKQKKAIEISSTHSLEFSKITKLLSDVSKILERKNKQKLKYTAKLKFSNRQKDDIISAISHEFKNPIAVISGYTQTLEEDRDISPKIREKFLGKIALNAKKMTLMIDRLRLVSKLEESKQKTKFTKVKLKRLIEYQVDNLKASYPKADIIITGKELSIEADEMLLGIALINLIENALKYSEYRITIELKTKEISIIDSGIGISQKEIENISKKFYRVSTNSWDNSLGIGLSLVKNIVELHHFTLNISSVENKGSVFTIRF